MLLPHLVSEIGGWALVAIAPAGLIALAAYLLSRTITYTVKRLGIFGLTVAFYTNRHQRSVPSMSERPSDSELTRGL